MEAILIYFVKVSAGVAAFYFFYRVALRHQKSFRFNRIYLSSALFLSFLIPLITITIVQPATRQLVILPEVSSPAPASGSVVSSGFDGFGMLFYVYLGISGLFVLNLTAGYRKAISIVSRCRAIEISALRVFITGEEVHPFTFFNRIVIPERILAHPDIGIILKHEQVHAKEKHTLDILSSEILFLFQWFNPFAWLLKKAIKDNLEYLTDHEVLHQAEMEAYQLAMVSMADQKGVMPFLNALNGNDLKNRIIMMKKKTENKNGTIRRLMVIPLLTILIAGLSNKEFKAAPLQERPWTMSPEFLPEPDIQVKDSVTKKKEEVVVIGYPAKSVKGVTNVSPVSGNGTGTIKMVTGVPLNNTESSPGKGEVTVIGYGIQKEGHNFTGDSLKVRMTGSGKDQPLYILDGKEIPSLDGISPESIESISVLKNESATVLYGEKGKNGVILITSKNKKPLTAEPLIILDGKETTRKVAEIKPEDIQSVSVLKGETATQKYGEKGKNGVIEIAMKSFTDKMKSAISTVQDLRKHIAQSILYPAEAQENGQQGGVRIYAFVNNSGKITQITETKPKADIVSVDEVVVVAYAVKNDQSKLARSSTPLNDESALRVKNLPDLYIPEFMNSWVEFQFKFVLQ